jgi:hypothetical protein
MAFGKERKEKEPDVLTIAEYNACSSEITWREFMARETRRQTLVLQQIAGLLNGHGEELKEIREHFASWAVEEPGGS